MAFEAVTRDWLDERTLAHDGELLVVDKPCGVPVHGGGGSGDLVTALKRWLVAQGHDEYLGVHQRLDQDTSGVLLFARCRHVNRPLAEQLESHRVHRTYLAAVGSDSLPARGTLEHRLTELRRVRVRVVREGGRRAVTHYRVLQRAGGRALVELRPETGRTHQLRVQLAAAGSPVAGDRLYGGEPAARLMLHASELRVPVLRRRFRAPVPPEIAEWVRTGTTGLRSGAALADVLRDAIWKRRTLAGSTEAYRLVNDMGDLAPGVVVDRYGSFAVLSLSSAEALDRTDELARVLLALGAAGVYLKRPARADPRRTRAEQLAPRDPVAGQPAPEPLEVREGRLRVQVSLGDGLSTGLFVDQRDGRRRIARLARGMRVLNLFSYTCSFSLAAALGGAREVVSVDLSARALQRGRDNFGLNGLAAAIGTAGPYRFVRADAVGWLARARRRPDRFDLVILDPPSFSTRSRRGTFRVADDYGKVARDALAVLAPGGGLLAVTNHQKTSLGRLRRILREAADRAGREVLGLKDLPAQPDCPPGPEGPFPSKAVMVTVR